jgi:AraC-like DNA-binding protein
MTIQQFNTELGMYSFTEKGLETSMHAHPALELLVAREGRFSIKLLEAELKDLHIGIVEPNQTHAICASECTLDIILIEPGHLTLASIQEAFGKNSVALILALNDHSPDELNEKFSQNQLNLFLNTRGYDERIERCMLRIQDILDEDEVKPFLRDLANEVCLSEGRLSHLFKSEIGISIQKYIIWTRLKKAIKHLLQEGTNLNEAALSAGFYDMAHFSRCFKAMMGLKPSQVYNNSRIVQI